MQKSSTHGRMCRQNLWWSRLLRLSQPLPSIVVSRLRLERCGFRCIQSDGCIGIIAALCHHHRTIVSPLGSINQPRAVRKPIKSASVFPRYVSILMTDCCKKRVLRIPLVSLILAGCTQSLLSKMPNSQRSPT